MFYKCQIHPVNLQRPLITEARNDTSLMNKPIPYFNAVECSKGKRWPCENANSIFLYADGSKNARLTFFIPSAFNHHFIMIPIAIFTPNCSLSLCNSTHQGTEMMKV